MTTRCPCGRGPVFDRCCGRLHGGAAEATTAEDVMRARYCAFVVADDAYLLRTWHPTTRPVSVGVDTEVRWIRLEVVATTAGDAADDVGTVAFRAHHEVGGQAEVLEETSRFERHGRRWHYVGPA